LSAAQIREIIHLFYGISDVGVSSSINLKLINHEIIFQIFQPM